MSTLAIRVVTPFNGLLKANRVSCLGVYSSSLHFNIMTQTNRMSSKHAMAKRIEGTDKNVWVEFGRLAVENNAINLGQENAFLKRVSGFSAGDRCHTLGPVLNSLFGHHPKSGFPDMAAPPGVIEALCRAAKSDNVFMHQYTRSSGHPRLVKVLSKLYSPLIGREIDPMNNVLISIGAYGSLFTAIQGLINPGDQVIIIEPFFDCYEPMVKVAGGSPVFVPLRPTKSGSRISSNDWKLDFSELESKFNSKTKAIILNTPNNPLGKVFTRDELEKIADLCIKYDIICISDEVYEWLVYDGNTHIKIASLPGMWERTLTIGSAGKTFSVTGWKLGWTVGPEHLIYSLQIMHQNCTFTCPTLLQEAVAESLEKEMSRLGSDECYLVSLAKDLRPKRNRIVQVLEDLGMSPTEPEGGYFVMADYTQLDVKIPDDGTNDPQDFQFVRWMTREKKLSAIPPSAFYSKEHKNLGENFIRFCFIKEDSTLEKAEDILKKWRLTL